MRLSEPSSAGQKLLHQQACSRGVIVGHQIAARVRRQLIFPGRVETTEQVIKADRGVVVVHRQKHVGARQQGKIGCFIKTVKIIDGYQILDKI